MTLQTLGALKASEYRSRSVKEEMRANLIAAIRAKKNLFGRLVGYEETVIPELERAILAGHNICLLGLRGQAKTTIARLMTELLDEYIPVVEGAELNDDPLRPVSAFARARVEREGDDCPITWVHRSERYTEKLATPDVSVADLIGDLDPIKAANLGLSYSDEQAIHYGLVPHANRGIFVINELPDLQPRIQVALFNILQEGDVQIRGFKHRLPLDIQFVFTANPEDYTNRGSIITPLKDRIQSQIITHYPQTVETAITITRQEARLSKEARERITVLPLIEQLVEEIAFAARESEFVDQRSGVSARLSISAYESVVASAERRMLRNGSDQSVVRISDLVSAVPAITGKVELVYEGEQEGAAQVAHGLVRQAIRGCFAKHFPNPEKLRRKTEPGPYDGIIQWFTTHQIDLDNEATDDDYRKVLTSITPLMNFVDAAEVAVTGEERYLWAEFTLHALAEYSLIGKTGYYAHVRFNDMLGAMLG